MKKLNIESLNLYTFLSFVFIVASASIAVMKLTELPPEYTMITAALLFGAVGALQCMNLQKRHDQLEVLKKSMENFKLTATDD